MKNKLKFNLQTIDKYDRNFQNTLKINTFYEKNVYVSRNIMEPIHIVYQMFGDLGAQPMNEWPTEKKLTNIFIISEKDYEDLNGRNLSDDVAYIEMLINSQQTIVDRKENKLTSKIKIVKFSTFKEYCADRKSGNFQPKVFTSDMDFQKEIYKWYTQE